MPKPGIVADTNVIISGLLWTGAPHEIFKLAEDKLITIFSSFPIIEETSEVLGRRKFIPRIEKLNTTREELIESLINAIEIVQPLETVKLINADPDDNQILECALAAPVEFIISGDPHLLMLKRFKNISIITPQKFIQWMDK